MAYGSLIVNGAFAVLCAFLAAGVFYNALQKVESYEKRLGANLKVEEPWQRFKLLYRLYLYCGLNFLVVATMIMLQGLKVSALGLYIGLYTILTVSVGAGGAASETERPLFSISALFRGGAAIGVIGCAELVVSKGVAELLSSPLFADQAGTVGEMVLVTTLLPVPFLVVLEMIRRSQENRDSALPPSAKRSS